MILYRLTGLELRWAALKSVRHLKIGPFLSLVLVIIPIWAALVPYVEQRGVSISVPVNMLLFYIGSLSFFMGATVFDSRCPRLISEFGDRFEFVNKCVSQLSNVQAYQKSSQSKVELLTGELRELLTNQTGEADIENKLKKAVEDMLYYQASVKEVSFLETAWQKANKSRQKSAKTCAALFLLSGVINLYITLVDAPLRVYASLY